MMQWFRLNLPNGPKWTPASLTQLLQLSHSNGSKWVHASSPHRRMGTSPVSETYSHVHERDYRRGLDWWLHLLTTFFSMAFPDHSGPRALIQFRNHYSHTVGLLGRVISPSQGRNLNTGQYRHRINAYTHQTPMSWVGFELNDPSVRASEDSSCLKRRGYCYWPHTDRNYE
jgi:hypothetical protein